MKIKYIFMTAVASLTMIATSCSGFLDQTPYTFPVEEEFWKTPDQADAGVVGTYSLLRRTLGQNSRYNALGDIAGCDWYSSPGQQDWTYLSGMQYDRNNSYMTTYRNWTQFYQVINQVNRALVHLENNYKDEQFVEDGYPENYRTQLIGELYFLRGFTYYTMYKIWGGVPMVTEVPSSYVGAAYLPRALESEIAELIYGDLQDALERLDWEYVNATDKTYRANKGVVYATLAHMAAWDGDYVKCVDACNAIINSGMYELESSDNIKAYTENVSDELIFQQFYGTKDEATNPLYTGSLSSSDFYHTFLCNPYWGNSSWGSTTAEPGCEFDDNKLKQLFADGEDDLRWFTFFGVSPGGKVVCHKFNNFDEDADDYLYCLNNRVIFRLADIYLLRAEGNTALGNNAAAMDDLNKIRNRSGLKNYDGSTSLFRAILDERGRELFLEGHRYYDMCRYFFNTGISVLKNTSANQMEKGKYRMPVDPALFENNIVTLQNPFWQGKV